MLGVSATPVNDALSRLVGEQFLGLETRKGYYVRDYSCSELVDLMATRAAIEGMAARLACEHASDEDLLGLRSYFAPFEPFASPVDEATTRDYSRADVLFHQRIVALSANALLDDLYTRVGYVMKCNVHGLIRSPDATIGEHRAIVEAMLVRDTVASQHLLTEHVMRSRAVLEAGCSKKSS